MSSLDAHHGANRGFHASNTVFEMNRYSSIQQKVHPEVALLLLIAGPHGHC